MKFYIEKQVMRVMILILTISPSPTMYIQAVMLFTRWSKNSSLPESLTGSLGPPIQMFR